MATVSLMLGPDHRVPCNPQGGTATVQVDNTGGTVYWAESPQGTISNAEGSIAPGGSQVFTGAPVWLLASQLAGVQITVVSADDAGGSGGGSLPASVVKATAVPGAPTSGTWTTNQAIIDSNGVIWTCTAGGTPGTWVQGSGGVVGAPYTGLVATRTRAPQFLNTTIFQSMSRSLHVATENLGGSNPFKLMFANWFVSGAGNTVVDGTEKSPGGVLTLSVSIEYPAGTFTRVTFGSANTAAVADGGTVTSDAMAVTIPVGATFWVRTYQSAAFGNISTTPVPCAPTEGFVATGATDLTMGGAVTAAVAQIYRPLAIIGTTTKETVLVIGDSIAMGQNDTVDGAGDVGLFTRPLIRSGLAYANVGVGSDRATWFTTQSAKRRQIAPYVTRVLCNYGVNDCMNSRTYQQLETDLATIAAFFSGQKFFQSLIMTTTVNSTDFWTTLGNQSLGSAANQNVRNGVNAALLKNQVAGITGVIDTRGYEASEFSGTWPVETNGRTVTDYSITSGQNTLTSATAAFTPADDFKFIRVYGAGPASGNLTAVMRYVSATQVTLQSTSNVASALNASTTVAAGTANIQAGRSCNDGLHPLAELNRAFDQSGRMLMALN